MLNQAGISLLVAAPSFRDTRVGTERPGSSVAGPQPAPPSSTGLAPSHAQATPAAMIDQVRPACPDLRATVLIGGSGWDELLAAGRAAGPADRAALGELGGALSADDPINIQYTSGTTGFPKGATLSHHNIVNNGYFVGRLCGYTPDDRVCIPVPFYHCFGMVMGNLGAVTNGATMVIPGPGFDPAATLHAVAAQRCTSLYGVPTMFIAELNHPDFESYDRARCAPGSWPGRPARSR